MRIAGSDSRTLSGDSSCRSGSKSGRSSESRSSGPQSGSRMYGRMSIVTESGLEDVGRRGRSVACRSTSKQRFLIVEATPARRMCEACSVKGVSFVRGRMES